MDDFYIAREVVKYGGDIQRGKDGQIFIQVSNGFVVLKPDVNFNGNSTNINDLFTCYRIKFGDEEFINFFRNIIRDGPIGIDSGVEKNGDVKYLNISESGVSKSYDCMYLSVCDNWNGYLMNNKDGKFETIKCINEVLARDLGIVMKGFLNEGEDNCVRIEYLMWFKGADFQLLKKWNAVHRSFVCLTRGGVFIYEYESESGELSKKIEVDIGINTYFIRCEQGKWIFEDDGKWSVEIYLLSADNTIIVKKCWYKDGQWGFYDGEVVLSDEDDYIVSYQVMKGYGIVVVYTGSVIVYTNGEVLKTNLNALVAMDNLVSIFDEAKNVWYVIACNKVGNMKFIVLNSNKIIYDKEFNYITEEINDEEFKKWSNRLPLFSKLESQSDNYCIDTLRVDFSGRMIYMLSLENHNNRDFEFNTGRSIARERATMKFSILKSSNDVKVHYEDVNEFNSLSSGGGSYWQNVRNLQLGLQMECTYEEINKIKSESDELFGDEGRERRRVSGVITQKLIIEEIEQLLKKKRKTIEVIKPVDLLVVTGEKVKLPICGGLLHEEFNGKPNEEGIWTSIGGRNWKSCSITKAPILGKTRKCGLCKSEVIADSESESGEAGITSITRACPVCPFCSTRWVV